MIQIFTTGALLFFLIICIGFFSSSETAYLSLSKIKIRQLVKQKIRYAKIAASLKNDITNLLTLVLIGTNFINTLSSALATSLALKLAGSKGVGIASALITFCVTIFGQIIPKTASVLNPGETALRNAPLLFLLKKILYPVIFIFSSIAKCASFLADKILGKGEDGINEEEIKLMIDIGTNEGTLEENERALLYKIFKFGDLHAHDIMKHRSLVKALPVTSCTKDVIEMIEHSNFSRIPLYEKSLDKIVGVIDYKTILYEDEKNLNDKSFVTKKMKTPLFLPETFTAIEVLLKLKKSNEDFAIVLDEQGVTAGIITIDDIMRVVFERLTDENAEINEKPEERIKIIQKNEYIIPGDMNLDDVNALTFLSLTSESFNTFGGYVLEKFGYLPVVGEAFKDKTGTYIIEDVARRRIVSVRVKLHAN